MQSIVSLQCLLLLQSDYLVFHVVFMVSSTLPVFTMEIVHTDHSHACDAVWYLILVSTSKCCILSSLSGSDAAGSSLVQVKHIMTLAELPRQCSTVQQKRSYLAFMMCCLVYLRCLIFLLSDLSIPVQCRGVFRSNTNSCVFGSFSVSSKPESGDPKGEYLAVSVKYYLHNT